MAGVVWLLVAIAPLVRGGGELVQVTSPVVHGEGPHWDEDSRLLYFVDITNQTVNTYDPKTHKTHQVFIAGGPISPVVRVEFTDSEFIVGRGLDLTWVKWDGESSEPAATMVLSAVDSDKPLNRFNDGKVDSSGRLWAGTMGPENPQLVPEQGSLYSFEPYDSFKPVRHLTGVSVSNGLGWNHNDTLMFYIDSPTQNIDVFDFNIVTGQLDNRRVLFSLKQNNISGVPDGMALDSDDNLWVAIYNGGRVLHIDSGTGELLESLALPVSKVTSCAFGGDHLDTLFITTSRVGLSFQDIECQPAAGAVFSFTKQGLRGQKKNNKVRKYN